ncbi:MAG: prepilin-type N-terminal cleavage/methylation domain-containing protein [Eubacteriales bacterium]|nr:prepilin-type N-terminal cleavage/methylation domain-containing protein [Eubacteriales bacterium]
MRKRNKGFTLVEMVVAISIFVILLGIMVPSLNSVLGFRVQRATNSIAGALDKTKVEAMSRLVGELRLQRNGDGYYISYILDRGRQSGVQEGQAEKIAPSGTKIGYTTDGNVTKDEMDVGESLILTYDREDGSFREIQTDIIDEKVVVESLDNNQDVVFKDGNAYCTSITVKGGFRSRIIKLDSNSGEYIIEAA